MKYAVTTAAASAAVAILLPLTAAAETLTIVTVNNPDMTVMKTLGPEFEKENPDIKLKWSVLGEGELNARVMTDVTTHSSSFDIVSVGPFEVKNWSKNDWLVSLSDKFKKYPDIAQTYDVDDLVPTVRDALSSDGSLYALPFYAEASMTFYRKDLFKAASIDMPEKPTWPQVMEFAKKLNKPDQNIYGICLRGQPIWTGGLITMNMVANAAGARWFDEHWNAQFNTPEWKTALQFYVDLAKFGPPGVTGNNYTENLNLFAQGRCAIWIDATVAAGYLSNQKNSTVAAETGYVQSPVGPVTDKGAVGFHSWALAIPKTTPNADAAFKFINWATSKKYQALVAETQGGWNAVPPGTRKSLYENPEYKSAAKAFAGPVYKALLAAKTTDANAKPIPYQGVAYFYFPEYAGLATEIAQYFSGAVAGQYSVDDALSQAQSAAEKMAVDAGYKH